MTKMLAKAGSQIVVEWATSVAAVAVACQQRHWRMRRQYPIDSETGEGIVDSELSEGNGNAIDSELDKGNTKDSETSETDRDSDGVLT
jgi:hypothetical protein